MRINPTKRKDGWIRFTINLQYNVNRNDLIDGLCKHWEIYRDLPKKFRSKKSIINNLKGLFRQSGEFISFDRDRDEDHQAVYRMACKQVEKFFPELA